MARFETLEREATDRAANEHQATRQAREAAAAGRLLTQQRELERIRIRIRKGEDGREILLRGRRTTREAEVQATQVTAEKKGALLTPPVEKGGDRYVRMKARRIRASL